MAENARIPVEKRPRACSIITPTLSQLATVSRRLDMIKKAKNKKQLLFEEKYELLITHLDLWSIPHRQGEKILLLFVVV